MASVCNLPHAKRARVYHCTECGCDVHSDNTMCTECTENAAAAAAEQAEFDAEWVLSELTDADYDVLDTLELWCTMCKCDESCYCDGERSSQCAGCGGEMMVKRTKATK